MKKFVLIFILIVISLSLSIYFLINGTPWGKFSMYFKAKEHLDNRYGEEMVIERIGYNFKTGYYSANAYEKNEPNIRFKVGENLGDTYIRSYLTYHIEKKYSNRVNDIFNKNKISSFNVSLPGSSTLNEYYDKYKTTPDLSDVKEVLHNKGEITFNIRLNYRFNDDEEEYKKVLKAVNIFDSKDSELDTLKVCYCSYERENILDIVSFEISKKDFRKINETSELKRHKK